jgi:hypothetical protein
MPQLLASHVDRLQGFTRPFIADRGTLVICDDQGMWYYYTDKWTPSAGLNNRQWIKMFHATPPINIAPEQWGICHNLIDDVKCRDKNWTRPEIAAAITSFIDEHFGMRGDGFTLRPAGKARHLSQKRVKRLVEQTMTLAQADVGRIDAARQYVHSQKF